VLIAGMAASARAFKVGVFNWPAVHEGISEWVMVKVIGQQTTAIFRDDVISGVFNTDFSHQPEAPFHFDSSTMTNAGFDNGFDNLHSMLAEAKSEAMLCDPQCRINPMFLSPWHSTFRDMAEDVVGTYLQLTANGGCLEEWACPTTAFATDAAEIQGEILPVLVDNDPDPDPLVAATFNNNSAMLVVNLAGVISHVKGELDAALGPHCRNVPWDRQTCFTRLEDMLTDHPGFQSLAQHLRQLQQELQAYYAWQHLGHALHSTQDFFAHSDYVEIDSCRHGPVCDFDSPLCDHAISESHILPGALPLPTDSGIGNLQQFRAQFSKAAVIQTLDQRPPVFKEKDGSPSPNSKHLQTGFFDLDDVANACHNGPPQSSADFQYCHNPNLGSSPQTPGLNKDEALGSHGQANYANFDYSVTSATRASVVLLASFFNDLPGGQALVSSEAASLAQPSGSMVPCTSRPSHGLDGLHIGGPAMKIPWEKILMAEVVQAPHTKIVEKPSIADPNGLRRLPPPAIFERHAYVQVAPKKVFHAGEHTELVIKAFDRLTGEPLNGAPVEVGNVRGLTFKPIALTIGLGSEQQCSSLAGQKYCLNRIVPPAGRVILPAGYPAAEGNFIIPTIVPQLLVSVSNGGLLNGQTNTLTVFARDAQTRRPIQNGTVVLADRPIGQANRMIIHRPVPVGSLRVRARPEFQNKAALLGRPMVLRVPGYSDEVVRYAIASPQ
jgi:hypothetical protein